MSGFDAGNSQGAISRAKQFGSILRGFGPPVPKVGVVGDLYIDVTTFQLFARRLDDGTGADPWGHYLFVVPVLYQTSLKFFGTVPPTNDIGVPGDYFLQWGGYPNYGMNPVIFGPKQWSGWPQSGDGPGTFIGVGLGTTVLPVGLAAEGATLTDQQPLQLIGTGLLAEFTIPVPVTANDNDPVGQTGLQSNGVLVTIAPNSRYTAEDEFAVA